MTKRRRAEGRPKGTVERRNRSWRREAEKRGRIGRNKEGIVRGDEDPMSSSETREIKRARLAQRSWRVEKKIILAQKERKKNRQEKLMKRSKG